MAKDRDKTRKMKEQINQRFLRVTPDALDALRDMMTDENINPLARVQAIGLILDRGLGKAKESIQISNGAPTVEEATAELEAIFAKCDREQQKVPLKKSSSREWTD